MRIRQRSAALATLTVAAFIVVRLVGGTLVQAAEPTTRPVGPFELAGKVEGACTADHTPFSRDGARFSTETANEAVRVWDSRTLKPLTEPLQHGKLRFHRLSGDGKTVMTAGGHEVCLWDVATSKLRSVTKVSDKEELWFADLSPDGKRFVTISLDNVRVLSVWETGAERPKFNLRHQAGVVAAEFDPTGRLIVTHEYGIGFHVWTADTGHETRPPIQSDNADFYTPYRAPFTPTGQWLVAPRKKGFVVAESAADKIIAEVKFKNDWMETNSVHFIAGGTKVAVSYFRAGSNLPMIGIYEAATGKLDREVQMGECQTGPEGRWALGRSPGDNPSAEVWDLSTGAKVQSLPEPLKGTSALSFMSPDGSMILVESAPSLTSVWRLRKELRQTQAFGADAGPFRTALSKRN